MASCHEGKLQISSAQKEGTEVESANPGQPLLVQPQSETETNTIKGGSDVSSRVSHLHCSSGNLLAQVCLLVGGRRLNEATKRKNVSSLCLTSAQQGFWKVPCVLWMCTSIGIHYLAQGKFLDVWDLSKFLRDAEQIKRYRDGLGKGKM